MAGAVINAHLLHEMYCILLRCQNFFDDSIYPFFPVWCHITVGHITPMEEI